MGNIPEPTSGGQTSVAAIKAPCNAFGGATQLLGSEAMKRLFHRPGEIRKRSFTNKTRQKALRARGIGQSAFGDVAPKGLAAAALANIELKFRDHVFSGVINAPNDAANGEMDPATFLCLNGVAQGDGPSEREGRNITQHSIYVRGAVSVGPTTNATYSNMEPPEVFLALVLDTQTNLAQANSEDVYTNPSATSLAAPFPFRNLGNDKRFRVLKTKRLTFTNSTYTSIAGPLHYRPYEVKPFEWYVKLKGLRTTFTPGSTNGQISTITDNSLHVIAYCNVTDLTPTLLYNSRLRFTG